ncbi:MAG: nodulation protein NfeD [Nitrospirae bacterium]|nr:nodulation protein NfeD [Nitrospirota bacterium]
MRRWFFLGVFLLIFSGMSVRLSGGSPRLPEPGPKHPVWVFPLSGPVTPPMARTLHRWFARAHRSPPALIVLEIDTPGGLAEAMRSIIRDILSAPVPVVGFVSPGGARAASAGTYILYACPLAAMSEGTNVGSATPIPIGGDMPLLPSPSSPVRSPSSSGGAEDQKIVNDAVAAIRSLAELNGRNADWAEKAVRSAANLSAREALKNHVVNLLAPDVGHLLRTIHGMAFRFRGREIVLDLLPYEIRTFRPDRADRWLEALAHPDLAYFFFLAGIAGLAFEFSHPGLVLPGVAGLALLILSSFGLMILPVNLAGLLLIFLGISLMIAEIAIGAFGVLGFSGIASFLLGSLFFYRPSPRWTGIPSHPGYLLIVSVTLVVSGLFLGVLRMALKARFRPAITGKAALVGETGKALEPFRERGRIRLHSEIWWATSPVPVSEGQDVRVQEISGLTLVVEPVLKEEKE